MTLIDFCEDMAADLLERNGHPLDDQRHIKMLARDLEVFIKDWMDKAIDNYEPTETGEAWSGGFADNH